MNNFFPEKKLVETVGQKSENLHLMRFVAAIMVIISHSFLISTGSDAGEWFVTLTHNQLTMGGFAVSVFFLCGGYLIAMSVEKNKTAMKYFSARVLRLFPPLIFSTVLTIFLGGFISEWGQKAYYSSVDTWRYLQNIIFMRVYDLPGVFVGNPYGTTVNGSLWTLPVEFICYVFCFIAYKFSFFKKKIYPISIPIVLAGAYGVYWIGYLNPMYRELIRPVLLFYIGMGYWVYREHITLNIRNFLIAVVGCIVLFVFGQGQAAMLLCFPYIMMCMWFGMKQCSPKLGKWGNYSYGIYLWGFPAQQLVMYFYPEYKMNYLLNIICSIPIAIVMGIITYNISEKWFLKRINNLKQIGMRKTLKTVKNDIKIWIKNFKCPEWIYLVILVVYSMRHVNWGLDLWDTGYSYGNFQYIDHMDPMWLFSTYLSNIVGNILTHLPFADTLLGMNFYTTLFVAALAVIGYFFCTRVIKTTPFITFLGEFAALNLCWCPSSVLYNYLTYLLLLICVVFLFKGLTQDKKWALVVAGIFLGANVLTRFSNAPQAALILAVWAYGVIERVQNKEVGAFLRTVQRTLWCLGGYLVGLASLLIPIHIKYGIGEYVNGIIRLFSMTETAPDYQPNTMVLAVYYKYLENWFWVKRMLTYILVGMIIWAIVTGLKKYWKPVKENEKLQWILNAGATLICVAMMPLLVRSFYLDGMCGMDYYGYSSIISPAVILMMLTMFIVLVKVIRKDVTKEEKLFAIIVLLMILINSIGSNNGVFSSFNNLFLAAPYTIYNCYLFVKDVKDKVVTIKINETAHEWNIPFYVFPVKCILTAFMCLFLFQTTMFGYKYFFTEATGAKDVITGIDNNEILKGTKMSYEKADWMSTVTDYVDKNDLEGRELILYGHIPSLSYYLQMPPAFNSWLCLGSYSVNQMSIDMAELQERIDTGEVEAPVVITETTYPVYEGDPKWEMIEAFMDRNGYQLTFANSKFMLYEPNLAE